MPRTSRPQTGEAPAPVPGSHSEELLLLIDRLGRLSMANERMRATLAKELDMSLHELNALIYVEYERHITPKALAHNLSLSTGSVTALVDRMVDSGLVMRNPHPNDRRSVLLSLTPKGSQVIESIVDRYARTTLRSMQAADPTQIRRATALVEHLVSAMDEEEAS